MKQLRRRLLCVTSVSDRHRMPRCCIGANITLSTHKVDVRWGSFYAFTKRADPKDLKKVSVQARPCVLIDILKQRIKRTNKKYKRCVLWKEARVLLFSTLFGSKVAKTTSAPPVPFLSYLTSRRVSLPTLAVTTGYSSKRPVRGACTFCRLWMSTLASAI